MKQYSMDLRERVMRACAEEKGTREEIAQRFQVSTAWIRRLHQRQREVGTIEPLPHGGGHPPAYTEKELNRLRLLVKKAPDATLEELREKMGKPVSLMAVWRSLKRLNLRYKKNPSGPANKTARTSESNVNGGRKK